MPPAGSYAPKAYQLYYKHFRDFVNSFWENFPKEFSVFVFRLTNRKVQGYNRAMKVNYDKKMSEILSSVPKGTPLFLHSCCAPCSSACIEALKEYFRLTVFYYNPNIDEDKEYEKRKAEQIRFLQTTGWADFLDCEHDKNAFEAIAAGMESEPERGKRCYLCYGLRLDRTARAAAENGFEWFCTTLSLSPYKNADWLNELGNIAAEKYGVRFLTSDFKKKGGYYRSLELSEEYGLYRQNFCGCRFSKSEAEKRRKEKISGEE